MPSEILIAASANLPLAAIAPASATGDLGVELGERVSPTDTAEAGVDVHLALTSVAFNTDRQLG